MNQDDVTLGEIHRVCQRIETAVEKQNGRVRTLETQMRVLWLAGIAIGGLAIAWIKQKLGL